ETLVALEPDGRGGQKQQQTVRNRDPTHKQDKKHYETADSERDTQLWKGKAHDGSPHDHIGNAGPVDIPASYQELFVDRFEQIEVEVAGPNQVGKIAAVHQEERFDEPG